MQMIIQIKKDLLIFSIILISIFIINLYSAESQRYLPQYSVNVSVSSNLQYNTGYNESFSWIKNLSPFSSYSSNLKSNAIGDYYNILNNPLYNNISAYTKNENSNYNINNSSFYTSTNDYNNKKDNNIIINGSDYLQTGNITDFKEFYPIGYTNDSAVISNGNLIFCQGKIVKTENVTNLTIIYTLEVISLNNPEEYIKISSLDFESKAESLPHETESIKKLLVNEDYVYMLTNNPAGLYVVDLTNIDSPELINYVDLGFIMAEDIEIQKDWAFIIFNDNDTLVTSWYIYDPENIEFQSSVVLDGWAKDIFIDQDVLIVIGDETCGLNIIDASNPVILSIVDYYDDIGGRAVWMIGGNILTAGGDDNSLERFRILDTKEFFGVKEVVSSNLSGEEEVICAKDDTVFVLTYSVLNDLSRIHIFTFDESSLKPELSDIIKYKGKCDDLKTSQDILMAKTNDVIILWDITIPNTPENMEPVYIKTIGDLGYSSKPANTQANTKVNKKTFNVSFFTPTNGSYLGNSFYSPTISFNFPSPPLPLQSSFWSDSFTNYNSTPYKDFSNLYRSFPNQLNLKIHPSSSSLFNFMLDFSY